MGKRELLIALAFVLVGAAAYQLTAPPPKEGERGFSFSRMFSGLRREIGRNAANAEHTNTGTLKVTPAVTEIRLTLARSVGLTVIGEDRQDVAYEMPVSSTGPDAAAALEYAKRVELKLDDLGSVMTLALAYPEEGSQRARLALRVPLRLAVRVEGGSPVNVSGVAGVTLVNVVGETTLSEVAGAVTGAHRGGDLTVSGAASVDLNLRASRAKITGIRNSVSIVAQSGECHVRDSKGPAEIAATSAETSIADHAGPIRITGEGGEVRITNPARETSVDMRRADLDVSLDAPVALTLLTSDEPLRLTLDGPPDVVIDAVAGGGGTIQAADFSLTPEIDGRDARLTHAFKPGGARVVLRNPRGEIVIAKRK